MNRPPQVLFLFEHPHEFHLEDNKPPSTIRSHCIHMFLLMQESIRLGWTTYYKITPQDICYEVLQVYPNIKLGTARSFQDIDFQPDMMIALNWAKTLVAHRGAKPNAIGAYVLNAHFWLESVDLDEIDLIEWWRLAFAKDVDFVLTQNPRMQDLAGSLFGLITGWGHRDRILCAPNVFCAESIAHENQTHHRDAVRQHMGVGPDDIVIINSGGPHVWMDTEAFATAFCQVIREGAKRLKYFQMGIIQVDPAHEHLIIPYWNIFMDMHRDVIDSGNLRIYTDWDEASACLPAYNYGADVGLNVNRDTPENYQSHRVRFIDYVKAALPVLNTEGSYYAAYPAKDAVITVKPGDIQGYVDALWKLERGEIDLTKKRQGMQAFKDSLLSDSQVATALKTIWQRGRIPAAERMHMAQRAGGLYRGISDQNFANRFFQ